jgi:hypothetical protein
MMNIIGDIAGQYKTLLALLKKMPDDEVLSVGDMVDRGPDSFKVLQWFKNHGKAVFGNHEHLMLDAIDNGGYYQRGIWLYNGGGATIRSFGCETAQEMAGHELVEWVRTLPLYVKLDGALVSHSFIHPDQTLEEACNLGLGFAYQYDVQCDQSIIWNRTFPIRRTDDNGNPMMQIVGHNSQFGLRQFKDDKGPFALCLDDCRQKVLTGLHWPSMQVYQQEFIDE